LARVHALGLPAELFGGSSDNLVEAWRARAGRLYPSDLRASPAPVRLKLLASLCWARQTVITDGLVDLLITLVHKVDATAVREALAEGTTGGVRITTRRRSTAWISVPATPKLDEPLNLSALKKEVERRGACSTSSTC
jgi:hypothetical protein